MVNQATALIAWLNTILTTYQEPVPDTAVLPYISLGFEQPRNAEPVNQQLTIWTRSENSYAQAYGYATAIETALGEVGIIVDGANCKLWIKKGSPFVQNRNDDERTIRAVLVNLEISYYYN
jgi:hypothetical protein